MRRGGSLSGVVSLVMIFCVLCLAVFAVLTLSTAVGEQRLTNLSIERTQAYYAADAEATRIAAALARGEATDGIEITWERHPDGDTAAFSLPCGGEQILEVAIRLSSGTDGTDGTKTYEVLRWQTVYEGAWETDDTLELFDF